MALGIYLVSLPVFSFVMRMWLACDLVISEVLRIHLKKKKKTKGGSSEMFSEGLEV